MTATRLCRHIVEVCEECGGVHDDGHRSCWVRPSLSWAPTRRVAVYEAAPVRELLERLAALRYSASSSEREETYRALDEALGKEEG